MPYVRQTYFYVRYAKIQGLHGPEVYETILYILQICHILEFKDLDDIKNVFITAISTIFWKFYRRYIKTVALFLNLQNVIQIKSVT